MHRLRLFPICGAEDEAKAPPAEETVPTREELAALQRQLQQEQSNRKKLEGMLLDPSYVEFVATRSRGGKPDGGKAAEAEKPEEPDFDGMSSKDLVRYLDDKWEKRAQELVQEVRGETGHERSVRVINETAGRHPDFWTYRETLEQIAQVYPGMHPEHAYLLAKALPKPVPAATASATTTAVAEPRATSGERPSNTHRPARAPGAVSGADAFRTAWKRHVGNKESIG